MTRLWLKLWLFFLPSFALAQESNRYFNSTTEQGLPTNSFDYIFQDSYGFNWLASFDGLFRWDGHSFKKYQANSIVYTIFEDSRKRLWVGGLNGLFQYDRINDQFNFHPLRTNQTTIPVNAILEDRSGQLWLGTSYGLCAYDPVNAKEEWFSTGADVIFCMDIDASQNIWIGTINGGLQQISVKERKLRILPIPQPAQGNPGFTKINSLLAASDSTIWVGTENQGLYVLNKRGELINKLDQFSLGGSGKPNLIRCLYEDRKGTIWIGVVRDLVYFLPKGAKEPIPLKSAAQNNENERLTSITSVMEDNSGNTWFTSIDKGLFYTNQYKNRFISYKSGIRPEQIPGAINGFVELPDGKVWIGTNGAGIYSWDFKKNQSVRLSDPSLYSDAVNDMQPDGKYVWIATWGNGIRLLDSDGNQLKHFHSKPQNKNGMPGNDVKTILPDDSLVWIGTHGEGLVIYNKRTDQFIHEGNNTKYPFNLKAPAWINHLFKDSQKRIWISTYSGLFVIDGETMRQFIHANESGSIGSNSVNMVTESPDGRIWIVHEAGLDRFIDTSGKFERIATQLGLPPAMKSIKVDGDHLWISSNEGILELNSSTFERQLYRQTDGLASDMFQRSVFISRKGEVWTAGSRGFIRFKVLPDQIQLPHSFYFTELQIYSNEQKGSKNDTIQKNYLYDTDTILLNHNQSFFSISFTSPNYYAAEDLRFRYKLDGLRNEWIDADNQRKLLFTNLPTGSYTLIFQVLQRDGHWKAVDKKLHLVVLPPWWKTWWFNLILLLITIGLVLFFISWRVANIKARNLQLKSEIKRHTASLQEKNEALMEQRDEILHQNETIEAANTELIRQTNRILDQQKQMVQHNSLLAETVEELQAINKTKTHLYSVLAHDLKNPVHAQAELSSFLLNNLKRMNKAELETYLLSLQRSSSALHDLLLNLLNWARTESNLLEPEPTIWDLSDLVAENLELMNSQFRNKNITVAIDLHTKNKILADRNMIDAAFRNILSNACKYSKFNGIVEIRSETIENRILITVKDYGIGMSSAQLNELFSLKKDAWQAGTAGEKGVGLGLLVANEFMKANGGSIQVVSTPGSGSLFTLAFPLAEHSEISEHRSLRYVASQQPSAELVLQEQDRLLIHGKKILIVDDNREVREYLKLVLSGLFEIFEASGGENALKIMDETIPDIILADLLMPGMDGLRFCKEIKSKSSTSHIPVILLTSQVQEHMQKEAYSAGVDIYLEKPVKNDLLIQLIINLILKKEKQRELIMELVTTEQSMSAVTAGLNKSDEDFLRQLVELIETNLADSYLDARMLSKEMSVSRSVLYAKIKSLTGNTVHEFIKSVRLRKSVKLLLEGRLSITQVAFEVGFSSRSYFDRCFVKQYKLAPREYINNYLPGKNKKK
ncbi:two-component regulator propeller domain-containing protein [Flavihumibacter sp. UBA7668]|uniref:two-component regulator propeller domain-containing protein n=1 Tax=Flavihumibacter sp. UBA7668 TaxID=1946542 RepID=UPI0025C37221|nr:two-component regulator propeller domain-containing protein [Flavihumibacter sp. UBA7668]